jgi:hypothetical protein
MILRLGTTLARKIRKTDLFSAPPDPNPFADWTARLFTVEHSQYVLVSNTASLYSVVIHEKGIADSKYLIQRMMDMIRDVMEEDGFRLIYEKWVSPQTDRFFLCKSSDRSVTGSMNDLVFQARLSFKNGNSSPYCVSFRLNNFSMPYLIHLNPREAFRRMIPEYNASDNIIYYPFDRKA